MLKVEGRKGGRKVQRRDILRKKVCLVRDVLCRSKLIFGINLIATRLR